MAQDAAGVHFLVPGGPDRVPPLQVDVFVLGDGLLRRLKGPVRCGMSEIEKEGPPIFAALDHVDGFVGNGVREIEALGRHLDPLVVFNQVVGREVVDGAVDDTEEAVEAPLSRRRMCLVADGPPVRLAGDVVAAHVPFAGHQRPVIREAEHLGDRRGVFTEVSLIGSGAQVRGHVTHAGLVRIEPGQERRPGWTAPRAVVHRREHESVARQGIEMRGLDFGSHDAEIRESHVVDQNENDVGFRGRVRHRDSGDLRGGGGAACRSTKV